MTMLRMRDATFARGGEFIVRATSLDLLCGEHRAVVCARANEARVLALMACAQVKPTTGHVSIGAFDPRVQPVHCKRLVAHVAHDVQPFDFTSFDAYVDFRATLCGIDAMSARLRAHAVLERLSGVHEAFAYPLAAVLAMQPRLLVIDRPQRAFFGAIRTVTENVTLLSTHLTHDDAQAFTPSARVEEVSR